MLAGGCLPLCKGTGAQVLQEFVCKTTSLVMCRHTGLASNGSPQRPIFCTEVCCFSATTHTHNVPEISLSPAVDDSGAANPDNVL